MAQPLPQVEILLNDKGGACILTIRDENLALKNSKTTIEIPFRHVLASNYEQGSKTLEISYVERKKKANGPHIFKNMKGTVATTSLELVEQWSETLAQKAYQSVKRGRRFKVIINPFGGVGKAVSTFTKTVEPIFKAAGCSLDVVHTTHGGHASEIASKLDLDSVDAVLIVSGDGLIHEVLNGFAKHSTPRKALSTPIAPIPAGSGNALSLNLMGIKDGFDVVAASINAIKGNPMHADLFLVTQSGKSSISFMSQCAGLMAEVDLGTDHLRWMGDARFMYGFLRGALSFKNCEVELSYKLAEESKKKMADTIRGRRKPDRLSSSEPGDPIEEEEGEFLRPRCSPTDTEGWTTYNKPMLYIYAGKGPYVGRDYMAFPASLPDDGLIDVVVVNKTSRGELFSGFDHATKSSNFWREQNHYIKAHACRLKPLSKKAFFSVDGEYFPPEELQVEVLPKHASFLSLHNTYAWSADFEL